MVQLRQPAQKLPEVCSPLHAIAICTSSHAVKWTIDGITKNDSHNAGDIMVVPANVRHGRCLMSEGEVIVIALDPSLVNYAIDDATNLKQTELVPRFPTSDPLMYQLGLSLKNVLENDPIGSRLYAETTASMLSVHLLRHYSQHQLEFKDYTDGLPRATLRRVIDYVQTNLDQDLGLAELATIAHLSLHYFARLFKQSTGYTPHQFVVQCRVERAKTLLLSGKDSIAEIAQQVGFANQAHLNVHFKRLLGVTPMTVLKHRKNQ